MKKTLEKKTLEKKTITKPVNPKDGDKYKDHDGVESIFRCGRWIKQK